VPRKLQGAMQTCGSCRMRLTFPESASVNTSNEPFSPTHQTGVATAVPSRLKVVTLMKGSVANVVESVPIDMTLTSVQVPS
jgi:hypothetical protein